MANKLSPYGKTIVEGSISHGTLRSQDLLRSFASELEAIKPFGEKELIRDARELADDIDRHQDDGTQASLSAANIAGDVVDRLFNVLESAAPDGMYFGTLEGDGSDFGFWRIEEED